MTKWQKDKKTKNITAIYSNKVVLLFPFLLWLFRLFWLLTVLQFANNKQTGLWVWGPITRTNITISLYKAKVSTNLPWGVTIHAIRNTKNKVFWYHQNFGFCDTAFFQMVSFCCLQDNVLFIQETFIEDTSFQSTDTNIHLSSLDTSY